MKTWVNSRTKTEDYTWRMDAKCGLTAPPPSIDDGYEKWKFEDCVPWFGLVAFQDDATLYFGNLITNKEDSRGRQIFIHAALQAENSKEILDLVGFVASLLAHEEELLPKWTSFFSEVFDKGIVGAFPDTSHPIPLASQESIGRFVYPRKDASSRDSIARRLGSGVNLTMPLAVGTTGRGGKGIFERVCRSEKQWQTAFFSSTCSAKEELQVAEEPPSEIGPNTRAVAAAIGGAALLVLFAAAIGTCSREGRQGEAKSPTGRGTNASASRQDSVGRISPAATNSPTQEATLTNILLTSQKSSDVYVTPAITNAPQQESMVTNALLSSQNGLGGPVTSAVTNTLQQIEAVETNSIKAVSPRTEKRKTENE